MKFCKDCKHCRPGKFLGLKFYEFSKCAAEYRENLSGSDMLVSGIGGGHYCSTNRRDYLTIDGCGVDGKYWEAA